MIGDRPGTGGAGLLHRQRGWGYALGSREKTPPVGQRKYRASYRLSPHMGHSVLWCEASRIEQTMKGRHRCSMVRRERSRGTATQRGRSPHRESECRGAHLNVGRCSSSSELDAGVRGSHTHRTLELAARDVTPPPAPVDTGAWRGANGDDQGLGGAHASLRPTEEDTGCGGGRKPFASPSLPAGRSVAWSPRWRGPAASAQC